MPTWLNILLFVIIYILGLFSKQLINETVSHVFQKKRHENERKEKKEDEQIVSLQLQIEDLTAKNKDLNERLDLFEAVEKAPKGDCYIRKVDGEPICPICWRKDSKQIPISIDDEGRYRCRSCNNPGVYDHAIADPIHAQARAEGKREMESIQNLLNYNGI